MPDPGLRAVEGLRSSRPDLRGVWARWSSGDSRRPLPYAKKGFPVFSRLYDCGEKAIAPDDFAIALSGAYEWIYASLRALRLNAGSLAIQVSEVTSVVVMRSASRSALGDLFEHPAHAWHPGHDMIFHPP